ncbi:MAG TPA: hypothetical protein VLK03_14100 [Nocardioides sp.]|nr:hypothetical protein [Nocardioides sp.]
MTTSTSSTLRRAASWTAAAALAASPLALATTTYAAPAKADSWTVTAKINETVAIRKETTIKVRGRVTPKAAGQQVVLQQRVGNKKTWKATGTTKVRANGTYVLKDDPSTPGKRAYRVVKPASNGLAKGISPALDVQVYAWEKLGNRYTGLQANLTRGGATIATEYYGSSLLTDVSGTPTFVEYTLGRKCLSLRSTYALTDSSVSGSSGAVSVTGDGAVLASHPLAVGTVVEDEVLDISDVFRLRFDLTSSATPAATAAVADPWVLCTR